MSYAKQIILRKILLFNFVNISKPNKTFCEIKFFPGTRFASATTISTSDQHIGDGNNGTGIHQRVRSEDFTADEDMANKIDFTLQFYKIGINILDC